MQSCPYETSVLRKYCFDRPATTNIVKKHFDYTEKLFTVAYNIKNKFVYLLYIRARTEVAVPVIWCYNKYTVLIIDCTIFKSHILLFLHFEFENNTQGYPNFLVLILFLDYNVKKLKYKYKIIFTSYKIIVLNKHHIVFNKALIHNVNCSSLSYHWLNHITYAFSLINLILFKRVIKKLNSNSILNGTFIICSDMEVDDISKDIKENLKSQIIKEEVLDISYEVNKSENEFCTVIKNSQNMKEPECSQINNGVNYSNHANDSDDKKEEKSNNDGEAIANGIVENCLDGNGNSAPDALLNLISNVVDRKVPDLDNKSKDMYDHNEVNGTVSFNKCNSDENIPIKEEERNNNENIPVKEEESNNDENIPVKEEVRNNNENIPVKEEKSNHDEIIPVEVEKSNSGKIIAVSEEKSNNDENISVREEKSNNDKNVPVREEKSGQVENVSVKEGKSSIEEHVSAKEEKSEKDGKESDNCKSCETKVVLCPIEKDKNKIENHSENKSSTCHQTSSSGKKADEHSWSHHSSSSSSSSKSKYKDHKGSDHRSSSGSKSCHERSSSHKVSDSSKSKYESSSKRSRSCHHKSDEKCHCKSRHHSHHHSKKSKKFISVKTQCTADEIAYELRSNKTEIANPYFTRVPWVPHPQLANLKYGRFYRIEMDRNGGASIVHLYMDEVNHLNEVQLKECAVEFIKLSYSEDENECAYHVMGIVHGAAAYLPDLVDYMADHYPTLTVKTGSLASRDNHTTTMSQYRDEVYKTYSNGTFRYAPLDQLSICGVLGEEVGAYFPDFVARLEQSPFMKPVMPWSSLSVVETDNPRESNDGPIFWVRPGEQMLPANEALKESARPKKRRNNELDNLAYIAGSRSSEARESLFMDRTKAHADQVGVDYGLSNTAPTAAVGVLKSVNCGHPEHGNRATKDVVAFHAQDYNELLEILMLDLYEPPQTQCTKWIEVSKLNTLRREGIRYAHVQLHDNDVYYLPRKIIHQFQTISSVASVAWHIRYKDYFSIMGAPNLHTPTGINKGQVFYEKKNVAVYYPPVCENELLASVTNPGSPLPKTPKKCEKLKDYSPFKHSPRKNYKLHSPRSSSKKERGSDSVPHTSNKKETDCVANDEDRKNNINSDNKHEDAKINGGKESSNPESSSKRERSSGSSKKSDKSEFHRSSDHSSSRKDRKEHDESESNRRKEVKNLEADFDLKKSKSKSTKSPSKSRSDKSGHSERRRSDESKSSESSSRHRKHDESKSKSSHSKHNKSSHKKSDHSSSVSNGSLVENSGKSEEKRDKTVLQKRKSSESSSSCPPKRIKEENFDLGAVSNGALRESVNDDKNVGEVSARAINHNIIVSNNAVKKENEQNEKCDRNNHNAFCSNASESRNSAVTNKDRLSSGISEESPETAVTVNNIDGQGKDLNALTVKNNADFDLIEKVSCSRGSYSSVVSHANPPLPSSSPPSNPPLPPNSPTSDISTTLPCPSLETTEVNRQEGLSLTPSSSPVPCATNVELSTSVSFAVRPEQENSVAPKDTLHVKKLKKKVVKKIVKEEGESYDLLGDIMSQMDKKK